MPLVGIVIGSTSDEAVMQEAAATLDSLGISWELNVLSAHRTPLKVMEYGATARIGAWR